MKRVCATGPQLRGVDLSHYQPDCNFDFMKSGGVSFAYLKTTEGLRTLDKTFATFANECDRVGILHGGYHFFHPSQDPVEQAKFFVAHLGTHIANHLPPVCDAETLDGQSYKVAGTAVLEFCQEVEKMTGHRPMIYGSPSFLKEIFSSMPIAQVSKYPLWIANYGVNCPTIPEPWTSWVMWQFSDKYPVPGVKSRCDANNFNGDISALKSLAGLAKSGNIKKKQQQSKEIVNE